MNRFKKEEKLAHKKAREGLSAPEWARCHQRED